MKPIVIHDPDAGEVWLYENGDGRRTSASQFGAWSSWDLGGWDWDGESQTDPERIPDSDEGEPVPDCIHCLALAKHRELAASKPKGAR